MFGEHILFVRFTLRSGRLSVSQYASMMAMKKAAKSPTPPRSNAEQPWDLLEDVATYQQAYEFSND
jgi:hypothetical protein